MDYNRGLEAPGRAAQSRRPSQPRPLPTCPRRHRTGEPSHLSGRCCGGAARGARWRPAEQRNASERADERARRPSGAGNKMRCCRMLLSTLVSWVSTSGARMAASSGRLGRSRADEIGITDGLDHHKEWRARARERDEVDTFCWRFAPDSEQASNAPTVCSSSGQVEHVRRSPVCVFR